MPQLPTEPEPPENIRSGKEDHVDLWGAPVVGDQDNNSGDGTDYGAFTETELHTDEDSSYLDQVLMSYYFKDTACKRYCSGGRLWS